MKKTIEKLISFSISTNNSKIKGGSVPSMGDTNGGKKGAGFSWGSEATTNISHDSVYVGANSGETTTYYKTDWCVANHKEPENTLLDLIVMNLKILINLLRVQLSFTKFNPFRFFSKLDIVSSIKVLGLCVLFTNNVFCQQIGYNLQISKAEDAILYNNLKKAQKHYQKAFEYNTSCFFDVINYIKLIELSKISKTEYQLFKERLHEFYPGSKLNKILKNLDSFYKMDTIVELGIHDKNRNELYIALSTILKKDQVVRKKALQMTPNIYKEEPYKSEIRKVDSFNIVEVIRLYKLSRPKDRYLFSFEEMEALMIHYLDDENNYSVELYNLIYKDVFKGNFSLKNAFYLYGRKQSDRFNIFTATYMVFNNKYLAKEQKSLYTNEKLRKKYGIDSREKELKKIKWQLSAQNSKHFIFHLLNVVEDNKEQVDFYIENMKKHKNYKIYEIK